MMETFRYVYRQLGLATVMILFAALAFLGLALLFALLGFSHAAASFNSVAVVLGFVFGGMLAVFLLTSLVAALVRFLERRSTPIN